jgi:hypothetical protein
VARNIRPVHGAKLLVRFALGEQHKVCFPRVGGKPTQQLDHKDLGASIFSAG